MTGARSLYEVKQEGIGARTVYGHTSDGDLVPLLVDTTGIMQTANAGPATLPYSVVRTPGDSTSGAAITVSLPAVTGYYNCVLGYFAVVDTAATTNIVTVILKDGATSMGTQVMAASSPIGTEIGTKSSFPIMVGTLSAAANLVVSAPGGSTVIHACIWGYTQKAP